MFSLNRVKFLEDKFFLNIVKYLEDKEKQTAQSHCDIFRQWGSENIDRTNNESLVEKNRYWQKNSTETLSNNSIPQSQRKLGFENRQNKDFNWAFRIVRWSIFQ